MNNPKQISVLYELYEFKANEMSLNYSDRLLMFSFLNF